MAFERKQFVGNAAATTLAAGITDTATTITIADATNWPTGSSGPFIVAIDRGLPTEEKVLCLTRTGTTITVRASTGRGHDGTTKQAHSLGAPVEHVLDAETIDQANRFVNLPTTKGDIIVHNGTNAIRLPTGATDASLDGYALLLDFAQGSGLKFGRVISMLSQAGAPPVAGPVRLWHDTAVNQIRVSNGSSWLRPSVFAIAASAAARNALISAPIAGDAVFRTDVDFVEVYNGSKWKPAGLAKFTNAAARDAYFTSPDDGDEAYLTGSDSKYLYRGSEWILTSHKHTVSANAPSSPVNGDLWLQPID